MTLFLSSAASAEAILAKPIKINKLRKAIAIGLTVISSIRLLSSSDHYLHPATTVAFDLSNSLILIYVINYVIDDMIIENRSLRNRGLGPETCHLHVETTDAISPSSESTSGVSRPAASASNPHPATGQTCNPPAGSGRLSPCRIFHAGQHWQGSAR